jgi:toxin ParE1/3/4
VKPVEYDAEARAELDAAVAYYEARQPGLGLDFLAEVEAAVGLIQQAPQAFPKYKATDYRRYVLDRFPYYLYYLESDHCLWIAAVAHHKRRPDYWAGRSP